MATKGLLAGGLAALALTGAGSAAYAFGGGVEGDSGTVRTLSQSSELNNKVKRQAPSSPARLTIALGELPSAQGEAGGIETLLLVDESRLDPKNINVLSMTTDKNTGMTTVRAKATKTWFPRQVPKNVTNSEMATDQCAPTVYDWWGLGQKMATVIGDMKDIEQRLESGEGVTSIRDVAKKYVEDQDSKPQYQLTLREGCNTDIMGVLRSE